jgi:hypothetical protein
MIDDGNEHLRQEWTALCQSLFNGSVPASQEWTRLVDIVAVMNAISSPANHMFYPDGGGLDLRGAQLNRKGELEWTTHENGLDKFVHVAAPIKLTFWNPGPFDHEANFMLEIGASQLKGDYVGHAGHAEELAELSDGSYAPRSAWDEGQGVRLVIRYVRPSRFAIFGKGSVYNSYRSKGFDAYDALHNDPVSFEKTVLEMAKIEFK